MSPAQAAYEAFSRSFDIREQVDKPPRVRQGPMPWDALPNVVKMRWKLVAKAACDAERAIAIEKNKELMKRTFPLRLTPPKVIDER